MVTVQDIGLQLTKPVKELAEWNFPFSQTLEKYCSLFNTTCNKNFGEAGLVLQNSTAVYVHRVDSLWNKTGYFRNVFSDVENEEIPKNSNKKKDRKTDMVQEFKTVDFAQEGEKNIDLKKNHIIYDIIKSKSRRFTQLEKSVAQHIPINMCDVNGEIIGKKYDFRCNQNVSMDGILIDEFTPQDFCCGSENSVILENSISSNLNYSNLSKSSLESSCNKLTDSTMQDDENNENANSDAESTRNDDDWQTEENSFLASTFESNQQNLSSSINTDTNNTICAENTLNDDCHEMTPLSNETRMDTPCDTSSPMITDDINNTVSLNNNDSNAIYFNDNVSKSIDISSVLDSPPESVNSKERTSSTDDPTLLNNTNETLLGTKLDVSLVQSIFPKHNATENTHVLSTLKSPSKSSSKCPSKSLKTNRKLLTPGKRKQNITKKNLIHIFKQLNSPQRGRPSMFKKSSTECLKYIREYNLHKYEDVTNKALDFLGFRLRVNKSNISVNDVTNINDNVMSTSSDDENFEIQSSRSINMSPPQENFCDSSFRTDSPHFMLGNVNKWHEYIQPRLREAEQRSTFCIRDYTSRVMSTLKSKQKINFDSIVQNEHPCEVARYFLASLDLAAKNKIDINTSINLDNIEIVLHGEDRQSSVESDSHE